MLTLVQNTLDKDSIRDIIFGENSKYLFEFFKNPGSSNQN